MYLPPSPAPPRPPRLSPLQIAALYVAACIGWLWLCNGWIAGQPSGARIRQALLGSEGVFVATTAVALFLLAHRLCTGLRAALHAARTSEAAANRTAGELRRLLEMLPEAVLISRHGAIAYVNRAAEELLSPGDGPGLAGRSIVDFMACEHRDSAHERMCAVLEQGLRDTRFLPRTMVRIDGSTVETAVGISAVFWQDGPAVLHLVRNIDETVNAQRAARRAGEEMAALSRRLMDAQERERRGIARELHDEIGQCLSAIRVQFAKLQRRAESAETQELLDAATQLTERTLGRVRSLSLLLHPPQLETLGLEAALQWHIGELHRLHDLPIALAARHLPRDLHPDVAIAAYRIVQESLSNALRHGRPQHLAVHLLGASAGLEVEVVDDGGGFELSQVRHHAGRPPSLGLLGMQERARLLGGDARVDSLPGAGTRIAAFLPWK